ncbi:MAG: MerR family transcriptional regulator [Peptostreptococcaceae bacterium]
MQDTDKISISKLAKSANVSVRTLQYYDQIGLLKPSSFSETKGRLYTENDIALLHQIVTLKSLGLTLDEIKSKINPVDNSTDVLDILNQQAYIINEQISKSMKVLESIEMIKEEILTSKIVDWSKYSNMMKLISDNNEYYWVINYLEKDMLKKISDVHEIDTKLNPPHRWLKEYLNKAIELDEKGVSYDSDEAQELASEWWSYIQRYTDGDETLIHQIYDFYNSSHKWPGEFGEIQKQSQVFLEKIIEHYLIKNDLIKNK